MEETLHDKKLRLEDEMKEKYADVINDLATKYEKPLDVGFDMLEAIARANLINEAPMYETDLEFNLDELTKEYAVIFAISNELNK